VESFDEKYTSDVDNNEDFNIELEKENEFNLFTPIKLTSDVNEKKNKDGAFSRDNRIIKKYGAAGQILMNIVY
jgi:hypothetical protein